LLHVDAPCRYCGLIAIERCELELTLSVVHIRSKDPQQALHSFVGRQSSR
jgi:hypothetical protein